MVAVDPQSGERQHGTVTSEARRIFENLKLLLESAGSSLDRLVQVHAMIYDRIEYDVLNRLYRQYVPNAPPARTVMSVQIEAGFKVMLDVIAAAETRQPAAMIYPRQVIEPGGWRRPGPPLSPAIRAGEFVFLSGMTAVSLRHDGGRPDDRRAGARHGGRRDAADPDQHGQIAGSRRL